MVVKAELSSGSGDLLTGSEVVSGEPLSVLGLGVVASTVDPAVEDEGKEKVVLKNVVVSVDDVVEPKTEI